MDLKLPIKIVDELSDDEVHATGLLDLASGDILDVKHIDYDPSADLIRSNPTGNDPISGYEKIAANILNNIPKTNNNNNNSTDIRSNILSAKPF